MTVPEKIDSLIKLRAITTNNVSAVVGEEITFYCPDCDARKFTIVPPDGVIVCPDCGFEPDMSSKAKVVTLTQKNRLKLINDLFQLGEETDKYFLGVIERYGECIDAVYARTLPAARLHKTFSKEFKPLEKAADWLLAGRNETPIECKVYSEDGLLRKQSGGDITVVPLSRVNVDIDQEPDETLMEIVEKLSIRNGYSEPFVERGYERVELLSCVSDPLDKEIVNLISQGCNKTDVSKMLGLTTKRLHTKLKHIGNEMLYGPKQKSNIVKTCKSCGEAKSIDDFGRDARKKDGLQGICRVCDTKRKKKVTNLTGKPPKIA